MLREGSNGALWAQVPSQSSCPSPQPAGSLFTVFACLEVFPTHHPCPVRV